jgi:hypothetical protein
MKEWGVMQLVHKYCSRDLTAELLRVLAHVKHSITPCVLGALIKCENVADGHCRLTAQSARPSGRRF